MPLNDDQKLQIEDALATAGYCLPQQEFARLVSRIETSIAAYECTVGGSSPREAMNALERLWKLTQKYDREELTREHEPNIDDIRKAIETLPKGALEFIERRPSAAVFLPSGTDFRQWARSADASDLVVSARALSAYGACWQPGRSRGSGKRSGSRLEPIIEQTLRGGRPSNATEIGLIANLATDWLCVTGNEPKPGRDIGTGFGYLLCSVFEWLKMADEADNSDEDSLHVLRQYWEAVKEGRNKPAEDAAEPDEIQRK
jgi:hypothetical protein